MRKFILARYLIREHLGPFFFAFFVITLLFLLNLLFRELSRILSKGLPWHVVVEFFLLNLAWIVALAVPMAVLTATLMAYGRLAADNEITAMQAGGISVFTIILPALVAASALAAALVWFNNAVLPDFNHRTRVLASDISRKRPTLTIEPGVWYDEIPQYGLLVEHLEDSTGVAKVSGMLINDYTSNQLSRTISARRGLIELSEARGALVIALYDGEMQEVDVKKPEEFRRVQFPKHVLTIPVTDMFLQRSNSSFRGDREKSAQQMREEVAENEQEIAKQRAAIVQTIRHGLSSTLAGLITSLPDSSAVDSAQALTPSSARALMKPAFERQDLATRAWRNNDQLTDSRLAAVTGVLNRQRTLKGQVERHARMIESNNRKSKSLSVEIQKKYSIPVACIVFV